VLLDANMPEIDGFMLAEKIRRRPRLAGAAIMMLTSGGRPGDRARCLELGVASYLTKPVKQSDLLDTIANALSARPGGRRARPRGARAGPSVAAARPLKVLVAEVNRANQHVVKGAVSNFAAPAAAEAAARLQRMGETGDLSEGRIAQKALEREMERVHAALASLAGPAPARRSPRKKAARRRVRRR
jgi:DNA-binding response OmpR family regulator